MYKFKVGFTLLELITVIFIIGVISAAAVFTIGSYFSQAQIDVDANKVVQVFRTAYSNSVVQLNGQQWGIYFDEEHNRYTLFAGTSYVSRINEHDTVFTIDDSLEFHELNIGLERDDIVFAKNTGHIDSDASLALREKNGGRSIAILINQYGQINTEK